MGDQNEKTQTPFEKFGWAIVPSAMVLLLGAAGAAVINNTVAVSNRPSRTEVQEMIGDHAPYTKDKKDIYSRLDTYAQSNIAILAAIKENSQEISELRTEVQKLNLVPPSEVYRMLRDLSESIQKLRQEKENGEQCPESTLNSPTA